MVRIHQGVRLRTIAGADRRRDPADGIAAARLECGGEVIGDETTTDRAPSRGPLGVRLDGRRSITLRITQASLRALLRVLATGGVDVQGLELIPDSEPLLLCSNHVSNLDPLVLGGTVSRVMYAMAKAELFRNPVLGAYMRACNCFPVRRDRTDVQALRAALAILRSGGVVVMYPEGHRGDGRPMRQFNAGVGYLAHKSGARVLPSAIWGTEKVLRHGRLLPARAPIHLRFGDPFFPLGPGPGPATRDIERRVAALLPPSLRPSADPDQGDGEDQG